MSLLLGHQRDRGQGGQENDGLVQSSRVLLLWMRSCWLLSLGRLESMETLIRVRLLIVSVSRQVAPGAAPPALRMRSWLRHGHDHGGASASLSLASKRLLLVHSQLD